MFEVRLCLGGNREAKFIIVREAVPAKWLLKPSGAAEAQPWQQ